MHEIHAKMFIKEVLRAKSKVVKRALANDSLNFLIKMKKSIVLKI